MIRVRVAAATVAVLLASGGLAGCGRGEVTEDTGANTENATPEASGRAEQTPEPMETAEPANTAGVGGTTATGGSAVSGTEAPGSGAVDSRDTPRGIEGVGGGAPGEAGVASSPPR